MCASSANACRLFNLSDQVTCTHVHCLGNFDLHASHQAVWRIQWTTHSGTALLLCCSTRWVLECVHSPVAVYDSRGRHARKIAICHLCIYHLQSFFLAPYCLSSSLHLTSQLHFLTTFSFAYARFIASDNNRNNNVKSCSTREDGHFNVSQSLP